MKINRFFYAFFQHAFGNKALFSNVFRVYKEIGLLGVIVRSLQVLQYSYYQGLEHANIQSIYSHSYNNYIKQVLATSIIQKHLYTFEIKPLISVIMPTYNPNIGWLEEAIESIQKQSYDNWELCIADDASSDERIKTILEEYQKQDSRIKLIFREENGHISEASNSALSLATGEFIALLDQDDILHSEALFWVVRTINDQPNARLIYSDEDKLDKKGRRSNPYFKCDWNYGLFLSQNLISHLGIYSLDIVKKIGGFRKGFEGSQDYDMALRFMEEIDSSQIVHIPRVLYHWRMHKKSTALRIDDKPYALLAAQKAISEHLERKGVDGKVDILENQMYRVRYILPEEKPLVSILIPTKNNFLLLKKAIDSIFSKTTYQNFEVIVIDNQSDDPGFLKYLKNIEQLDKIRLLRFEHDFNYSAINNFGVKKAIGSFVCFLNDDTEVISPDWLCEMVSIGIQEKVGVVGAKLLYSNNTLQHGGVILGIGGIGSHSHKGIPKGNGGYFNRACLIQDFSAVTAACMLVSKKLFESLGGFNELDLKVSYNDVDFCLKVREKGYRVVWTPYAELYHYESYSRGDDAEGEKYIRFQAEIDYMHKKWSKWIQNDPAYSPNLTLQSENFSVTWPSRLENLENTLEV